MRKALYSAVVALVATGVLASSALAGGGLSISFGIPFGDRDRHEGRYDRFDRYNRDSRVGRYDRDPRFGVQFRLGPSIDRLRRPVSGRYADIGREGREAQQSIRRLIQALRRGSQSERERAARQLGRVPMANVNQALIDALLHDPDKDVRKEAAKSLGNLGAEQAVPALRYAERFDPSKRVREAAEHALREIRRRHPNAPVWREPRYPDRDRDDRFWEHRRDFDPEWDRAYSELHRLLQELAFGDKGDRKDAAKKLGKLEDRRAVPALIDALRRDPEEDVREEAAEALGRIGDRSALPALRWAERYDEEKDVRKEAEKAIDKITD